MSTKKYWKGLEELSNSPEFLQTQQNEFAEVVPVEKFLGNDSIEDTSTSRRDFLKYLGFSVTAASLASCETPVTKAIPYIVKPEEVTPGVANWYASTYYDGNDYCSVVVKTREGRPIKIEGNKLSPVTKGGVNARVQASVLSLYDSERLTGPYAKNAPATWETVDKEIGAKLAEIVAKGGNVRILSSTIISPSTIQAIADFTEKHPTTKHIMYDAVSYYGMLKANLNSFGHAALPSYYFDKANTIVSVGADFLGNWISPIEFASQYSKNRKVSKEKKAMSKHIQFESLLSLSGANADIRVPIKPSEQAAVVVNLYNALAKLSGATAIPSSALLCDKKIEAAAKELWKNRTKSLVVCGLNDVNVQMVVNAINSMLDVYETTVDLHISNHTKQGNDEELVALVSEMKEGKVDALITYNCNPVYNTSAALGFAEAYKKVGLKVSLSDRMDETAEWADYICPDHHYLESWNDAEPVKGNYSLGQPTIAPLFSMPRHEGTRCAQETLLKWSGNNTDYHTYIQKHWEAKIFPLQSKENFFTAFWNQSLHDGVVMVESPHTVEEPTTDKKINKKKEKEDTITSAAESKIDLSQAAAAIKSLKSAEWELAIYQKIGIGTGSQANNPWLQELPDPISKVTWDNYITMSPLDMKDKYNLLERQDRMGSVVNLTVNGIALGKVPVYPQPGQAKGTIGLAVGYGRTKAGRVANNVGVNAFPAVAWTNGSMQYYATNVQIEKTDETHEFAATQVHHTMMGRRIVQETTLAEYVQDPKSGNETVLIQTHEGKKPPAEVNLWDAHEKLGHRWGMTIDLNSCIGCGACVISCNAENNVAVVGKDQVKRTREMTWIRIDRYYSSDMTEERAEKETIGYKDMQLDMENPSAENPQVVFQPMMCQHCNHAPCETVCPVLATNHSSEGLNQMTYNRCVGTRYCANNCPYKVRRFNWYNYVGHRKFTDVNPAADDLGRMVLNPDVVVRSRGVMEKCSMCVQRIQEGKLNAKKKMQKLEDGSIQTACAQSCPTNAIVFGDLNDTESEISKLRLDERSYFVLEDLGIQPSVGYLVKVRNNEKEKAEA